MNKRHFSKKRDKSPLLLILGIIFLFGAIFSFFIEDKKKKQIEEEGEAKQNPKDFI
jgi:hypothetical protein